MKTMSSGCVAIAAVFLSMVVYVAKAQVTPQEDDSVPLSVLITICVVVFFATVLGVVCFIQFCIKNYNPLDYCFFFCTKDKESPPAVQKNELGTLDGYESQTDTRKLVRESHVQATGHGRQVLVMQTEDLYARINKPGKRKEIVETTEIDGGIENAAHTVSTDVFTKDTVSGESRATENLYSETTTTTTSNQRENVFVHDNNIILRAPPARYRSESFKEDMVDGEVRTERYTYSTGYTPSSSREKLVVNMSGDDSERMRYYLEQVEGRKEVYTNESGETVIMVRDEPEVHDIESNLNIQNEENGYMNEEVRRVVTRKVVTEEYQRDQPQQLRQETHVIRSAPAVTKVGNIQQDDDMSSGNHVENMEVSRNYIVREAVDDGDDAQLQAAIQEIETVTSEAPGQVSERREVRVLQTTTTTTTSRNEEQASSPTSILTEHKEAHYIQSQAEQKADIPTEDYIIVQDDDTKMDEHIQRRGKSMMAIRENQTRIQGNANRHSYHGHHQSSVEVQKSQPTELVVSSQSGSQTTTRREVVESSMPSTQTYVYQEPESQEHRTTVTEQRIVQAGPEVMKTYVYETPENQSQQSIVRREERVITSAPHQVITARADEIPDSQEDRTRREQQTVIRREERIVQAGPEIVKTYVYETPENQSQQSIVRREERVITSAPHQIITARSDEIPESQEDRIRREQQTVIRREERIVQAGPEIVKTYVYETPENQSQQSIVRREERVITSAPHQIITARSDEIPESQEDRIRREQQTVIRREERIVQNDPQKIVTTNVYGDTSSQGESTVVREERYIERTGPTTTKHVYISEGDHGESRVITREEEIIEDNPSTVVTTTDATDGAAQAEVTYRVIKRRSQIVEQPEEESRETSNKEWYVSSATLLAPKQLETVYVDLGPDEMLKGDKETKTTTTTTTTYTVDTGEQ
ncbi:uncharacterized protein LOC100373675 [Saccoglossus kowalevskii]|uniref:Trichohyalin-like n=1 Tax=Saccoglossus kowalevskii TaxID=10224 RepID=A0ABM0GTP6_SACKO|nr:PREDICTED: trichohyalin-like [Saccoglossus kowalevskii]